MIAGILDMCVADVKRHNLLIFQRGDGQAQGELCAPRLAKRLSQEMSGPLEANRVDAMGNPRTTMPFDRVSARCQHLAGQIQGLDRYDLILVAMNQQDRGPAADGFRHVLRTGDDPRVSDDACRRRGPPQPDV
jgi:hypothetical protein